MRVGAASMMRRTTFWLRPARGGSTTRTSGRPASSTRSRSARADVAGEEARVADLVAPGVGDGVGDRLLDDLQAPDLAGARRHGQPDRADPAEEVEDALPALEARVLARRRA